MKSSDLQISCPLEYEIDQASEFHEGLAPIKSYGRWGFMDKSGKIVIKPLFEEVESFHQGLSRIRYNKKFGFVKKPNCD